MKFDFYKFLGMVGLLMMVGVALYLILKIIGLIHSASAEEVLLAVVVGQVFYSGYIFESIQGIERGLRELERKMNKTERWIYKI